MLFSLVCCRKFRNKLISLTEFVFAQLYIFMVEYLIHIHIKNLIDMFQSDIFCFCNINFRNNCLAYNVNLDDCCFNYITIVFTRCYQFHTNNRSSVYSSCVTGISFCTPNRVRSLFYCSNTIFGNFQVTFSLVNTIIVEVNRFKHQ